MLGVIIGVAAVVLLVAIGAGAQQEVEAQVQGLGSNLILVVPGQLQAQGPPTTSRLTLDDQRLLASVVGDERAVTSNLASGELVRSGTRSSFSTVQGNDQNLPRVFDRPLVYGEFFTRSDVDTRRRVAVIGADTAADLFGEADPVGRQIAVTGVRFRVIGVFARRGAAFGVSQDRNVSIPVTAAQRLFGVERIDAFAVKSPDTDNIEALQAKLLAALQERYPDEQFSAVTQTQILGVIGQILGLLTLVLSAIAGISLVVGGVGVSNIMLVSVRERTREIGLRKALGARQRDVLLQFLFEAVLLTTIGGVIGIALGVGGSALLDGLSPLPTATVWWSPLLAFGVSVAVGVFFGVAPARSAGRLDPVVALRQE
jgi:putative ABC transport system permease protein